MSRIDLSREIDGPRRALITVSVVLASLMQSLDNTIANVALPEIQGSLSATQDQMAWVLTSYIIAAAIMTPMSGWLAEQVGRRKVLMISVVGFTLASMLCGLAQTLPQIILARLMQGMCGAALVPMSQAVLLDITAPEHHGRAMAVWLMGVIMGPILGPALGGWLTENYNWRWVFYINVPFGIMAFLGILTSIPESTIRKSRFDFLGFAVLSLGIGALQLMMDRGQIKDWFGSLEICIEAAVAGVGFYLFAVHSMTTTAAPFVSPALFKDRNFLVGNVFMFVVAGMLFATLALLPPLLQDLLNYPVVTTGLVTAPRGIGTLIAMFVVGRIIGKIDVRVIITAGFLLASVSLWQMTRFDLQMDSATVIWSGLAQGLGTGFVFVPLTSAAFATLSPGLRSEGTAIFSLARNLGSSIGISVMETLLTRNSQIVHSTLGQHLSRFTTSQLPVGVTGAHALATMNAAVTQQAYMVAYDDDFQLMFILCLAAMPFVLLLRRGRPAAAAETAHIE